MLDFWRGIFNVLRPTQQPERRAPEEPNEVLVMSARGCEHCGSAVLRVLIKERRLRCMQCAALDAEFASEADARRVAREHAWKPAQSGRHGL